MASRGGSGILGAGGGFGSGLLLLVGGLLVKHAEAKEVALCSTGFGRFGQALDPNVANSCSLAQNLTDGATAAIWIGAIVLALAVIGLIAALIGAGAMVASKNAKTARPPALAGVRSAVAPGPRAAAGNPASFPAVSWDSPPQGGAVPTPPAANAQPASLQPANAQPASLQPAHPEPASLRAAGPQRTHLQPGRPQPGQRYAAPTQPAPTQPALPQRFQPAPVPAPPLNACGHEARPGARFCPVCGSPVAASRPATVRPAPLDPVPASVTTTGRHGRPAGARVPYPHQPGLDSVTPAGRPGRHRVAP